MPTQCNQALDSYEPNYFTCTLGQAAEIKAKNSQSFATVHDLLVEQCQRIPSQPALGIPVPSQDSGKWESRVFPFENLFKSAACLANQYSQVLSGERSHVALLCPSSVDFVFTWLALMLCGHSVLLIAPQCSPSAIAHLCKECNVETLLYDEIYQALVKETKQLGLPMRFVPLLRSEERIRQLQNSDARSTSSKAAIVDETHIAYLHHTSGTSSGLPKPIPQSHRAAVGVLPCLDGKDQATFTTTPLYHGGIADCFRSWTSGAMIWLFPGKDVPITAVNVRKSLQVAQESSEDSKTPLVRYFSSVPYVLQMVAADDEGLVMLQAMDTVGVGGAALPPSVGDELVAKGINLVSRFGSAECGFLMSSHRDYEKDRDWSYLRSHGSPLLRFEPQDSGLAELVIQPQWPHMAKRNREDGSYATADLFEPHKTTPNAWKYHSRADSQLTLITGKKFDPAPLEDTIATSALLADVLIFGNGQQCPGALLFRTAESSSMTDQQLLDKIWPSIEKMNAEGQSHTKISKSMLVVMPADVVGLEKSSKGTVLRRQAEEKYEEQIRGAYQATPALDGDVADGRERQDVHDHELPIAVMEITKSVIGKTDTIPEDADLFAYGVDSVACMQIRAILQSRLLPRTAPALPLNVVYDCGSIKGLSNYIQNLRHGKITEQEDEIQLMHDLVQKYSAFEHTPPPPVQNHTGQVQADRDIVILTGATGALGAHILDQLRSQPHPPPIICLVRSSSPLAAHERVHKALTHRLKPGLPTFLPASPTALSQPSKITCLPTVLHAHDLGLSPQIYSLLAHRANLFIHAAWTVNFQLPLRSFTPHLCGLQNLLTLALSSSSPPSPKFIFCSSTAAHINSPLPIPELISSNPQHASALGYSRSKWVAEGILSHLARSRKQDLKVSIARVGQLCGDTAHGVWNGSEAWPLMLSAGKVMGALPRLGGERLDWLPVDRAAKAVVEVAGEGVWGGNEEGEGDGKGEIPVYHILNPQREPKWDSLLAWAQESDPTIEILSAGEWINRLEGLQREHPARKLIGLWREAYCSASQHEGEKNGLEEMFEVENAMAGSKTMRGVKPIAEADFRRMWVWIVGNVGGEKKG